MDIKKRKLHERSSIMECECTDNSICIGHLCCICDVTLTAIKTVKLIDDGDIPTSIFGDSQCTKSYQ